MHFNLSADMGFLIRQSVKSVSDTVCSRDVLVYSRCFVDKKGEFSAPELGNQRENRDSGAEHYRSCGDPKPRD